ncbi:hypothetical protein ANABIO32_16010 [Rossellomorea marisflavi]|nr:hypothetical protein ANABIO32_16010 [Rossellomorea marisflavi]
MKLCHGHLQKNELCCKGFQFTMIICDNEIKFQYIFEISKLLFYQVVENRSIRVLGGIGR